MFSLSAIKSINDNAAAVAEEKSRKARGLKPKGAVGKILRGVSNAACACKK